MSDEKKVNRANPARFLTRRAMRYRPAPVRELMKFMAIPGMISLGGGMPNPAGFPFAGVELKMKNGTTLTWTDQQVGSTMQYGRTSGIPPLLNLLKEYNTLFHGIPADDTQNEVVLTTGSQDALTKCLDLVLEEGDSIILGRPCYPGVLGFIHPKLIHIADVPTDNDGVDVDAIEDVLVNWDEKHPGHRKPKVVYVIPTGSNPSGSTMTLARKQQLLRLASEHDLIVLEDDPYYFLTINDAPPTEGKVSDVQSWDVPPSLLSLDTEGRVIRFDSFSKVMTAGLRLGYATGPKPFIMRIILATGASCLHTSNVTQMMALTFLQSLGQEGFRAHVRELRGIYKTQRDAALAAAAKHLQGIATWNVPVAGMFIWVETDIEDTFTLVKEKAKDVKLLLLPGQAFHPHDGKSGAMRVSYSVTPLHLMDVAFERLAVLIRGALEDQAKAPEPVAASE